MPESRKSYKDFQNALGVIAIYIGSISQEVSGRPMYVVRTKK